MAARVFYLSIYFVFFGAYVIIRSSFQYDNLGLGFHFLFLLFEFAFLPFVCNHLVINKAGGARARVGLGKNSPVWGLGLSLDVLSSQPAS